LTQGAILRNPRTKYKRSKNVFTVTTIALTQLWTRVFAIVTASCEVSNRESRTLPGRLRTAEIPTLDILAPDAANMRPALEQAAESKRRALGNYFFEQICYIFPISKFRRDRDLGLCTTLGLAFGGQRRSGDFWKKNVFQCRKNWIWSLRWGSPNASPEVVHRPRSESPLNFKIGNI